MLSIIVIASFILPSVLEGCCMPDKLSATAFLAGSQGSDSVLVDFTQKKYIVRPNGGDIEYLLTDRNVEKTYIKYQDGSCVIVPVELPVEQCMPKNDTSTASANLVGVPVEAYTYVWKEDGEEDIPTTFVVTKETCLPVMIIRNEYDFVRTRVYTNVSTTVTDVTDIDQDISNCKEWDGDEEEEEE